MENKPSPGHVHDLRDIGTAASLRSQKSNPFCGEFCHRLALFKRHERLVHVWHFQSTHKLGSNLLGEHLATCAPRCRAMNADFWSLVAARFPDLEAWRRAGDKTIGLLGLPDLLDRITAWMTVSPL